MQEMEIITASGKSTSVPVGANQIKIVQPGSTVKVSVAKEAIIGSQKDGDNLILVGKNGSKTTIEDFFKTEDGLKNKLILEDGGKTYEAKYNAENFTGLAFFPVKAATDDNTDSGEINTAAWLVPLIIAAAAGIGIAMYNDGGSSHSHNSSDSQSSDSKEKQALNDAQKDVAGKDSALIDAQNALAEAVKAMQADPSAETIQAVEDASVGVKTAMEALDEASAALSAAIDAAKAKGIDTTAAENAQNQAAEDASNAESAIDQAAELVKTAISLTDESAQAIADQAMLDYKSASDAAIAANTKPSQSTIDDATAKLAAADSTLAQLNMQIEQLTQLIENAQEQGFNVDNATARLTDLQQQQAAFNQESQALVDFIAAAQQSLQDLDAANKAVDAANEAIKLAADQKTQAAEKLASAQALKDEVLQNNQLDRVDDVNNAISAANESLEEARQATEAANTAAEEANANIDKISATVDPALKPEKVSSIDMPDLQPIGQGLQIDDNKTFFESVQTFVKSLVDSVSDVWHTIANSKPMEFLNNAVSEITAGIKAVGEVLGTEIVAAVQAVKTVEKALVDLFISKPIDLFKDVVSITWQKATEAVSETFSTVKAGFDAVVSGIGKAITDALGDTSLLDLANPLNWIGLVKDVVVDSVSGVFSNVIEVAKTIPKDIADFFMDAISKYAGTFADTISGSLDVVKSAIGDVVKTLFDGFIKNPIEKLISPLLEKVTDVLSHPIESIQKLVSGITDVVKDSFNIIKSIIDLPAKWAGDSFQLIKDIYNSFKGDSVKNGDGSELQKLIDKMVGDQQSDSANVVNSLLKSSSASGDIDLSKLVPESSTNKIQTATGSTPSSEANYHTTSAMDDMHSSLPVAA